MTDKPETCPDCGRPRHWTAQPLTIGDLCLAQEFPSSAQVERCLRLTVERMRPVVEAARTALATIDRMTAAEADWLAAADMSSGQLHSLYDEANAETSVRLGDLRAAFDAYDGKETP